MLARLVGQAVAFGTSHHMTHDHFLESAAGYAVGALDGDERRAFEAHLPDCRECQEALEEYRHVEVMLAQSIPARVPPNAAALRARILREARGVRPLSSAPSSPRRTARGPWIAAAACLTLAVAGSVAAARQRGEATRLRQDLAAARAGLASRDSLVASFLGPEVHVVSLSEPAGKPSMRVFWNHTRNVFIVTAFNVPAPPQGKTYQLWALVKGKAPMSMGTFATDGQGRATAIIDVSNAITSAGFIDACGVTLEPAGGSPQPTEAPRLVGEWRHVD
jgi:anti-sigma-K factor RskA